MPRHTKAPSVTAVGSERRVTFIRRYTEGHPTFTTWKQWAEDYWAREAERSGLTFDVLPIEDHPQTVVSKARVTGKAR